MSPGQPMPMNGASLVLGLLGALDEIAQHRGEALHGVVARRRRVVVAMAPEVELPYLGLRKVRRLLQVRQDDAGADVGAADVDREEAVMAGEDPGRREVGGADEAGLVGMVADRRELDVDAGRLQQHRGAADRELADAALAQAAADHDALGVAPALQAQEAADHGRELLGEILDRALDDAGRLRVALDEELVELLLRDLAARRLAERVLADLPQALAPILEDRPEGAVARAVADEALLVAQLDIVAVDDDRRQVIGAVGDSGGDGG